MEVRLRLARLDDGPELADLRWEFRAQDEEPGVSRETFRSEYRDFFEEGLRSGTRVHFLAEAAGRILAAVAVQLVDLVPRPCKLRDSMGIITDNYASPEHRGRGIGTELLSMASTWARDNDLELLVVWPSDETGDWYQRNGFEAADDVLTQRLRPYYDPSWSEGAV